MCADTVSDIRLDAQNPVKDPMGDEIREVYSKAGNVYAVYGTSKRVKIQFSDSPELMFEQRRALSRLHPLRGQIDGLLDEWRTSSRPSIRKSAGIFDRRTADALTVALQGDQAQAESLLKGVRQEIVEEQESIGRARYLVIATICALTVFIAFMLISALKLPTQPAVPAGPGVIGYYDALTNTISRASSFIIINKIPLAAGFGALGALFSIAIGIRKRAIQPDMQNRDNIIDAILRVMIGVVSAVILFSLLRSQLVTLGFGPKQANFGTGQGNEMHVAIVIAFVAGFAEMLVGDYLTKAVIKEPDAEPAGAAEQRLAEAHEQNPRGRKELEQAPAGAGAAVGGPITAAATVVANLADAPAARASAEHEEHDHEAGTDGCLCGVTLAEDDEQLTGDVELPPATGGIDRAA